MEKHRPPIATGPYFSMSPKEFETAIAEVFRALGYEVFQTPFSNDYGKDAIALKRWEEIPYRVQALRRGQAGWTQGPSDSCGGDAG